MGQIEVYESMKKHDDRRFKTPKQINAIMERDGTAKPNDYKKGRIHAWLIALERWDYLEAKIKGTIFKCVRVYRIKKQKPLD